MCNIAQIVFEQPEAIIAVIYSLWPSNSAVCKYLDIDVCVVLFAVYSSRLEENYNYEHNYQGVNMHTG